MIVIIYVTIREPNSTQVMYYARATPAGPLIEPPKMLWVTIIFLVKEVSLFPLSNYAAAHNTQIDKMFNKFIIIGIRHIRGPRCPIPHQARLSADPEKRARWQIRRRHKPIHDAIFISAGAQQQKGPGPADAHRQLRAPRSRTRRFRGRLGGPGCPRAPVARPPTADPGSRARLGPPHLLPIRHPCLSRRLLRSPKHQRLSKSGPRTIMRYQESKIRSPDKAGECADVPVQDAPDSSFETE